MKKGLHATYGLTAAAVFLFVPLFIIRGIGWFDFWWWMSINLIMLISMSWIIDRPGAVSMEGQDADGAGKKIILGIASAVFLYLVFFIGNILSRKIFPFASAGIDSVYGFRGGASSMRIAVLMLLIIGPGEEVFWRGFIQRRYQEHLGGWKGFLVATGIYAAVHLGSGNIMLVLAALTCGLFWGFLYLRYRSMMLNIISHVIWDISVFLLFPFSG